MANAVEQALAALRELGSVEELQQRAAEGRPTPCMEANVHIHLPPNFSAFENAVHAVKRAAAEDVHVLGASNYYDYRVFGDFAAEAAKHRIFPLYGTEIISLVDQLVHDGVKINDPGNPGRMYLCGKGITRFRDLSDDARRLLGIIRRNDDQRMAEMIAALRAYVADQGFDAELDAAAVTDMIVTRHGCAPDSVTIQERHVAMAFQQAIDAACGTVERQELLGRLLGLSPDKVPNDPVAVQNRFRSALMKAGKPCFLPETFVSFPEAKQLILELGGIPCYPTLADGASPICPYETPVEDLVRNVRGNGLHMAEFIPIRNAPDVLRHYVIAMRAAGLAVAAGTEHNTLDLIPIAPACVDGQSIPADVRETFWEGACVVAAHQFLTVHGQCGFVDANGDPNPAYINDDARIRAFAALGAAVIERFLERQQ